MPFYPSAGAGGHCIPKDPTFLLESSKKLGIKFTTIENAITANQYVPKYITNTIDNLITSAKLTKSVIVCGLAYKSDIEDMRDSPGFKLIKEFLEKKFDVYAYDPFFKKELLEKYLIENKITNKNFEILPNLSDDHLNGKSCLCLVQHHSKTKFRINEIISNSKMPLIYDCQNKLPLSKSKTKIISFGNKTI
jgi:UDP-N-acetyl-D-glucosamine dehydrogenase